VPDNVSFIVLNIGLKGLIILPFELLMVATDTLTHRLLSHSSQWRSKVASLFSSS
jgi:hypothetical protein